MTKMPDWDAFVYHFRMEKLLKIATFGPKMDQNRHFFQNSENAPKSPLFKWCIAPNFRLAIGHKKTILA